jgi:hypothetical protein
LSLTNNEILSVFFIKRIYAKGMVNPKDLSSWIDAKIRTIIESLGDRSYWNLDHDEREKISKKINKYGLYQHSGDDNYLFLLEGFTSVIYHHYQNGIIEPLIETNRERTIVNDLISNGTINEDYYDWDSFDELKWKFANQGRNKYLSKTIIHEGIIHIFER